MCQKNILASYAMLNVAKQLNFDKYVDMKHEHILWAKLEQNLTPEQQQLAIGAAKQAYNKGCNIYKTTIETLYGMDMQ